MRVDQIYPSRYLKESDLRGRDVTVTIDKVEIVKIGNDTKPVCRFEGKEKGLVLNKTMFNAIARATGELDSDNWPGHRITLYPTETEFKGDIVPCIRVRLRTPENGARPARELTGGTRTGASRGAPPPEPPPDIDPEEDEEDSIPF